MNERGFVLVADDGFFLGAVAAINALRFYDHDEPITLFDVGLKPNQRKILSQEVAIADLDPTKYKLCGKGRAWESKAHALASSPYECVIYMDCDAFPVTNVKELFDHADEGFISGGKDGDGVTYGDEYASYGFKERFHNDRYFSTSTFSFKREKWQPIMDRWSKLCDENGGFGERAPYQGHGDQGVLNAITCAAGMYDDVNLLDNRLWSCHWTYFSHLPRLLNQERILLLNKCGRTQRVLHCGGAAKFWQPDHMEMVKRNGSLDAYLTWLKFLFQGKIQLPTSEIPKHLSDHHDRHRHWIDVLGTNRTSTHFTAVKRDALILKNFQSPGDTLMLTAAVRDLKRWYPHFSIDVRTPDLSLDLWLNNPHLTKLDESDESVKILDVEYGRLPDGLVHQSNQRRDVHFLHGFIEDLNHKLNLCVKLTEFKPDVHLTADELIRRPMDGDYWIIISGGKSDVPTKWVPSKIWQSVIDALPDVKFVQLGAMHRNANDQNDDHVHPDLRGSNVIDQRGKTTLRDCLRWIQHSSGVLCPVTFFMHAAAALNKKCITVAGGREPWWWEAYPGHDFIHTIGKLQCCRHGGCWRSQMNVDQVKDVDNKLSKICENQDGGIQKCMTLIDPDQIIDLIKRDQVVPRFMFGEMSIGRAMRASTVRNDVAFIMDGKSYGLSPNVISIRTHDIYETLDAMRTIPFKDAYVIGFEMECNLGAVHRLTTKLKGMPDKKRVHFCFKEIPPMAGEFMRTASVVTLDEGLKQLT